MTAKPKYAIINDTDAPRPDMVVQLVHGRGYCYLDRSKSRFDGMRGDEATNITAFGFTWVENPDWTVSFYRNEIPPTATYRDGEPREWQSYERDPDLQSFERKMLRLQDVAKQIGRARAAP